VEFALESHRCLSDMMKKYMWVVPGLYPNCSGFIADVPGSL
jgi:hypothetical protein